MAANMRYVKCTACDNVVHVGTNKRNDTYCQECRIRRYIENMASLKSKSGPQYEANVKATRDYYAQKARGGTLST